MPVMQSNRPPLVDEALLAESLRVLIPAPQVTEVRALDAKMPGVQYPRTISGYFDEPSAMIGAVGTRTSAKGIYLIPNPVEPALMARAANRIRGVYKEPLTSDVDITARRWLLIDADAVRPAGDFLDRRRTRGGTRAGPLRARPFVGRWRPGRQRQRRPSAVPDRPPSR